MKTTSTRLPRPSLAVLAILPCIACGACGSSDRTAQTAPDQDQFTITIDRRDNGAAVATTREDRDKRVNLPRRLSFEMAGFATVSQARATTTDQRAAASQAAIIDAFCKALIEARRSRGQSDSNFTARLGPRLTVTHSPLDDGYEVRVVLLSHGVETTFVVRNGILQHPPHDLEMIRRLFEETNGEFSLLATDWSSSRGVCVARVGCYLPAALDTAIAGDVSNPSTESP